MNRNEIRMKLWCDVYVSAPNGFLEHRSSEADTAVSRFDKRFPAESSEDEPKRVWVTLYENGFHNAYRSERAAKTMVDAVPHITAYAEFQQVGPMVRRDSE